MARRRANPWQEQECKGCDRREVWAAWESAQSAMRICKTDPLLHDAQAVIRALVDNEAALLCVLPRTNMLAGGRQEKEHTVSSGGTFRM